MPNKMKIRVHESEETLLDSFENLANTCSVVSSSLSAHGEYSLWAVVRDIQNGSVPLDTPADVKKQILKKKANIEAAFENFLVKLDAYL